MKHVVSAAFFLLFFGGLTCAHVYFTVVGMRRGWLYAVRGGDQIDRKSSPGFYWGTVVFAWLMALAGIGMTVLSVRQELLR